MNNLFLAFVLCSSFLLSSCENDEVTHSIDWYKTHEKELASKLAECRNNPGELAATPNCINAIQAKRSIKDESFTPTAIPSNTKLLY